MCEKGPFWRWLPKVLLVKPIRKIPELFKLSIGLVMDPIFEIFMGALATYAVALYTILNYATTMNIRMDIAILITPLFLITMHGIYRNSDC